MNFGKYAIIGPLEHQFKLEPEWWWKIKPVDSGMELEMSKFLSHNRLSYVGNEAQERPPTGLEIAFREIALTFHSTNVPKDPEKTVADGGEPFIAEGASIEAIEKALTDIPRTMLMEIWEAVGESYPYWGPSVPKEG